MKRSLLAISALLASLSALFMFTGLDDATLSLIALARTPLLTSFMRGVAFLGSVGFLFPFNLLMIWRQYPKKGRRALLLPLATLSVWLLNHLIKLTVGRARPAIGAIAVERTLSFPSGHAMVNSFFVMALAFRHYKKIKNKWIFLPSGLYILLMCFNRLYLGVHYPSDVLAGSSLGLLLQTIFSRLEEGESPRKYGE